VPIDAARSEAGEEPAPDDLVDLGDWVRPVLDGGQAVLLVDRVVPEGGQEDADRRWAVLPRDAVKAH